MRYTYLNRHYEPHTPTYNFIYPSNLVRVIDRIIGIKRKKAFIEGYAVKQSPLRTTPERVMNAYELASELAFSLDCLVMR